MARKRDHYRYTLWDGPELVYIWITDNPKRREAEHEIEGKHFTRMKIEGPVVTKESAERCEKERLEKYCKNRGGKSPRYNKTED